MSASDPNMAPLAEISQNHEIINPVASENNMVVAQQPQQPQNESAYQQWLKLDPVSKFRQVLNQLNYKCYLSRDEVIQVTSE